MDDGGGGGGDEDDSDGDFTPDRRKNTAIR